MERTWSVCTVSYYARELGEQRADGRRNSGQFGD
jgi:hypothetical protein